MQDTSTSTEGSVNGKKWGRSRTSPIGPEHGPCERLQRPFEIGKRDVLVDDQPLDLVEHGSVGGVGVAAIGPPGDDDVDGRPLLLHGPHLHRRGVGAQHHALADEEGVVQRSGRMIRGGVQGLEIVVLGLNLRAVGDLVAHAGEDVLDLTLGLGDQMQMPQGRAPTRAG